MLPTAKLLQQQRQPLIRFLGKRTTPTKIDHSPVAHPAAPSNTLPNTFATYRQAAQQHGPLNTTLGSGTIASKSGASLGPIAAPQGAYFDRSELPNRYAKLEWTAAEIEAIESGGASTIA
ncbi:hypothetical protein BT63DRAFT_382745 [Microthyrium microscopicum]|uniref:Ribosomal protein S36, mitochondrial n=1 Tax=Microthyrium microscopicum TaxID=703497 RepID=A0A6A6UN59_9PEZI|nr:hypothetical protein BT63DRAFT_382745 [Microthyrium microscopicum]